MAGVRMNAAGVRRDLAHVLVLNVLDYINNFYASLVSFWLSDMGKKIRFVQRFMGFEVQYGGL